MYYNLIGEPSNSKIICLMHGWGANSLLFKELASYFLSNGYTVLVVDFIGFGKSKMPDSPRTVYDYADDVIDLVLKLKINKLDFLGHSFGGRIAICIANKEPNIVNKIILVDSAGVLPKKSVLKQIKIAKYKFAKMLVKHKLLKPSALNNYGSDDYKQLNNIMKQTFVNVVNEDLLPLCKNIKNKTIIIWGENDKETPLYMAKKLNKTIINSELYIIKNAGHYSFLDKYNDFVYILNIKFLNKGK